MKLIRDQRGSIAEFATLVPLVLLACLLVLQLLLLLGQRGENHAMADRIAFIAATSDLHAARQVAVNVQKQDSKITEIQVVDLGNAVKVTMHSAINLIIPIGKFTYQVEALAVKEPS